MSLNKRLVAHKGIKCFVLNRHNIIDIFTFVYFVQRDAVDLITFSFFPSFFLFSFFLRVLIQPLKKTCFLNEHINFSYTISDVVSLRMVNEILPGYLVPEYSTDQILSYSIHIQMVTSNSYELVACILRNCTT